MIAVLINLYTIFGGILGFWALILASEGNFSQAFAFLLASMAVDGTDGLLARYFNTGKRFPNIDMAQVDNVIDMFTYAWIPFFIIWKLEALNSVWFIIPPIVAALYAYGQVNMKTPDDYFLGFPTYWNIVVLYVFILGLSGWIAGLVLILFSILSFVPTKYLYPSKHRNLFYRYYFAVGGVIWYLALFASLFGYFPNYNLGLLSIVYPLSYLVFSFWENFRK